MSYPKEPKYFTCEYDKGMEFYRKKYFRHFKGEEYIGDACSKHLFLPFIAEEIYKVNSSAKLIIMLRDPVERAYSHWWFFYGYGRENLPFSKAIKNSYEMILSETGGTSREDYADYLYLEEMSHERKYYLKAGYYYEQIKIYRDNFPKEQIKVILFRDYANDSQKIIEELRKFLALPPVARGHFKKVKLNSRLQRDPSKMHKKIVDFLCIKKILTGKFFEECKKVYSKFYMEKPKMDKRTRRWLEEHYYNHNKKLEKYLKVDLSHWS